MVIEKWQVATALWKDGYQRWEPKFAVTEDKRGVFGARLHEELCDFSVFNRKSQEGMYAEFMRAIDKVGLSVAKSPARRYKARASRGLKCLRQDYLRSKQTNHPDQVETARKPWKVLRLILT